MTIEERSILDDAEVVDLLADEPELLALADALGATNASPPRRTSARHIAVIAAVAIAALFALSFPWRDDAPTFTEQALAAVGDAPVLHVVTARPEPSKGLTEIATGRLIVPTRVTEIWFDEAAEQKRVVDRVDGHLEQDLLETRNGWFNQEGRVYTCAWISAHPVEATKAGVSCRLDGENGTTPRHVPEPPPTLDPALAGLVDGYRAALANGTAHAVGDGEVDGRPVTWLEVGEPDASQRVAVDRETYRPLRVEPMRAGEPGYDVLQIESISRVEADFSRPKQVPPLPSIGQVAESDEVSLSGARTALGRPPVWLGAAFAGLELESVSRQRLTTGYGELSGIEPTSDIGVSIVYGDRRSAPFVEVNQTSERCQMAYGWECRLPEPPAGYMRFVSPMFGAFLRTEGLYVTVRGSDEELVREAVRALRAWEG